MKRKLAIGVIVAAAIIIAVVIYPSDDTRVTVSFSPAHVETNGTRMKVTFEVTNTAARMVYVEVVAIERQHASAWVMETSTFDRLGEVEAHGIAQLSYVLPYRPTLTRLQVLVATKATTIQNAQFGLRRLWADVRYQKHYKTFWTWSDAAVPAYQELTPEFQ